MVSIDSLNKKISGRFDNLEWDDITPIREKIESTLSGNFNLDSVKVQQVATAAHELLQNTIQHGGITKKESRNVENLIYIEINKTDSKIILIVANLTEGIKAEKLINKINQMRKEDPQKYYLTQLMRSDTTGGLGLARINYECAALVNALYDTLQNTLKVKAEFAI